MKVPLSWLKDFVDIDVPVDEFVDRMTMSGSKVESIERRGGDINNVVVGRIIERHKHPNADRLQVCQVDVGSSVIQIVTGADNIKTGDYVPVALHGADLPGGVKIKRGKLRGEVSEGMMCSGKELGLTEEDYPGAETHGILVLDKPYELGTDIKEVLGLQETVVDFEITPNRPDCLSIIGIAREAAATFKKPLNIRKPSVNESEEKAEELVSITVERSDLCPRYAARIITDVKVGPSPRWMRNRLQAAGVRPINNVVDITNYVMLEYGQPMHAFDLKRLEGQKIIVRVASEGETFETLDGVERQLRDDTLVIADGKRPVAVAGIMGGANSEINENTTTVLLEAANFDKLSIRNTSRFLGLRTEASSRFEKGLDPELIEQALNRAAELFCILEAGKPAAGIIDVYAVRPERVVIDVSSDNINALLGTNICADDMADMLKTLEFEVDQNGDLLKVIVPTFRKDVQQKADLAEEIARLYGYDKIEPTLMKSSVSIGRRNQKQILIEQIKDILLACGLYEVNTYSFTGLKQMAQSAIPIDNDHKFVVIKNALGEEQSIMRTSLLPSMLDVLERNIHKGVNDFRAFEIARVFIPKQWPLMELPDEPQKLCIGMYGNIDFYDLKGIIEVLMASIGMRDVHFSPTSSYGTFHPGRTAEVSFANDMIGVLGEVNPDILERYDINKRIYLAEIDLEALLAKGDTDKFYVPLPKFPAVQRDMAIVVKKNILARDVEYIIKRKGGKLIEDIQLFDVYEGEQIPKDCKSIAYSITYRSLDRTLTDDEVDKVHHEIIEALNSELGAQLR